jgi:lipopolysaccharide heptosyltransferase II
MKVDLMRFIDRRLGVPVCFLLSCIHGLEKIVRKSETVKSPKKILFMELSEMGSMVLACPLFKRTKEIFPEAELYFLTFKENRYALDILGIFAEDKVITISSRNFIKFFLTAIAALWKLRRERISVAVDMELFARFTAIVSYLSGAKNRVGYYRYYNEGLYRGNFLTHRVAFNPQLHIAYNLLNLIYALISPQGELPLAKKPIAGEILEIPKLRISDEKKKQVLSKLRDENKNIAAAEKIIVLNPNASDLVPVRRWPSENYVELAELLLKHEGVYVVITGTESEREYAERIRKAVGSERCLNFSGRTSFPELIALYSLSSALVTNDSGPVHFSSLTDIKTFALFGPETPNLYGPLAKSCHVFYAHYSCSPCISAFNHRHSPCNDNKCLKAISAREVYEELKKQIFELPWSSKKEQKI